MSTVAEWITELDEHGFEDTSSIRKVAILNDTVWDVCSREPWPFLEDSVTLTYGGSLATASNFPTDFSKVLSLTDPTNGTTIRWERWEVVQKQYPTTMTDTGLGAPQLYYNRANEINVYPVPSSSDTLTLNYIKWPTELTANSVEADILIPPRHQRVVLLGTLAKLYAMEDDPELSALFKEDYENRIGMMREDLIRFQYDLADHIFVVNEDDYDINNGYYN